MNKGMEFGGGAKPKGEPCPMSKVIPDLPLGDVGLHESDAEVRKMRDELRTRIGDRALGAPNSVARLFL